MTKNSLLALSTLCSEAIARAEEPLINALEILCKEAAITQANSIRLSGPLAGQKVDVSTLLDANPSATPTILGFLLSTLRDSVLHHGSGRALTWFSPTINPVTAAADFLVSLFNPQLAVYDSSPGCYHVEEETLATLANWAGLTGFKGQFTNGGAESNLIAVLLALHSKIPDLAARGLTQHGLKPVFYVSRCVHLSIIRAIRMAGVGEDSIRWASVNSLGEVNCNEVEDCVLRDKRDGCLPVGIVANFGTTAEGAIDDYTRLADIAKRFEMWLHIDAAWGGGALVAGALSIATLDFDSISIDAHKMLMSPIGAGIFLSRRPELLNKAFGVGVRYELAHPNGNLFDNSPQWSRRFIGARVFAALASVGREGLRARITHHTVLARQLRDGLVKGGWKVINDSLLPIVCFKMSNAPDSQDDLIRAIFDLVTSETDFAITHTRGADGHLMLRAAICSSGTEERDIDDLVTELNRIKTKVQRGRDEAPV